MSEHVELKRKSGTVLIDKEDYEMLVKEKWYVTINKSRNRVYISKYTRTFRPSGSPIYKAIQLSRFVMNAKPGVLVDHINMNTHDNRKKNLRLCTKRQNAMNGKKRSGPSGYGKHSRYKGVGRESRGDRKFFARIVINGKEKRLGLFLDEKAAARRYDAAAVKYFGAFARINFPEKK